MGLRSGSVQAGEGALHPPRGGGGVALVQVPAPDRVPLGKNLAKKEMMSFLLELFERDNVCTLNNGRHHILEFPIGFSNMAACKRPLPKRP